MERLQRIIKDNGLLRDQLNDMVCKNICAQQENETLKNDHSTLNTCLQSALETIERMQNEFAQQNQLIERYKSENDKLRSEFIEFQMLLSTSNHNETENLKKQLETSKTENNKIRNDLSELRTDIQREKLNNRNSIAQLNYLKEKLGTKTEECNQIIDNISNLGTEGEHLPQLGDNNMEERIVQKFVNRVIHEAEKLKNSTRLRSFADALSRANDENQKCMHCRKPFRLARCLMRACGGVFHEECIHNLLKNRVECPKCGSDSIKITDDN